MINHLNFLVGATISFVVAVLTLWQLRPIALRIGLVDKPGERKHHEGAVPLVGGIGMAMAFFLGCYYLGFVSDEFQGLWVGGVLLLVVGVLDDYFELGSSVRFIAQISAAAAMIGLGHVTLESFGRILWTDQAVELGVMAIPVTIFCTVGVINALNMIDGVDGLAGSVSLTSVMTLSFFAFLGGQWAWFGITLLLATVLVAFLVFNWRHTGNKKALLFMGDSGSMFLGFALCWLFVQFSQGDDALMRPVTALWIFAVPLIDTVTMMVRRLSKGRSPFEADREHFHHIFLAAGFSQRDTVLILLGISLVCAGIGVVGELLVISEATLFYLFMLFFVVHFAVTLHAWKFMRFLRRQLDHSTKRPRSTVN